MRTLLLLTILTLKINLVAQDINYFFYDIPWTLGTDTICKVIRNDSKKFKWVDPKNGEDQGYYCVAKPFKSHYLKNKPDSVWILGFPVGFCDNFKDKDGGNTWVTGEIPAFSIELYYKSDEKRIAEFKEIITLLKKKYVFIKEYIDKNNSRGNYHSFKVDKTKDSPEIHAYNYFDERGTIKLVLYQIPN